MHTFPVPRKQGDGKGDDYSDLTGLDASDREDNPDRTRQEDAEGSDINRILRSFGVPRAGQRSEADYTLDLQTAIHAVRDAETGYARLPAHLKDKYHDWVEFLIAVDQGHIKPDDWKPPVQKPAETAPVS